MDTYKSSGLALLLLVEMEELEPEPGSKGLAFGLRRPAEGRAVVLLLPGEVARLRPGPWACPAAAPPAAALLLAPLAEEPEPEPEPAFHPTISRTWRERLSISSIFACRRVRF
jgi:hypothetical protein